MIAIRSTPKRSTRPHHAYHDGCPCLATCFPRGVSLLPCPSLLGFLESFQREERSSGVGLVGWFRITHKRLDKLGVIEASVRQTIGQPSLISCEHLLINGGSSVNHASSTYRSWFRVITTSNLLQNHELYLFSMFSRGL